MSGDAAAPEAAGWYPVAATSDLPPRHIHRTSLFGQELAVWRDDRGAVNAWENRCPHRGARLSIGSTDGNGLKCRYHGWRFASGSGRCTGIPAHPDMDDPAFAAVRTFASTERYGLVWAEYPSGSGEVAGPRIGSLDQASPFALRSVWIGASAAEVARSLLAGNQADPEAPPPARPIDPYRLLAPAPGQPDRAEMALLLQPLDRGCTLLHGLLLRPPSPADRLDTLRRNAAWMGRLRDALEAAA